ncbi:shikimate dehydrogenase [Terrabacter aeriphilus]|uniref:Shikimate dehydrogenase n=1 Tax=Terrabacter aeriphilus TaxID=515662 RepID=A0ABP9IZB3_9MICO
MLSEQPGPVTAHCAVWGSPVAHSLSPVLHRAAYAALGLTGWSYDRRQVDEAGFSGALAGLDPTWRGLSLTMPLKEVALGAASVVDATAAATGAANTLVATEAGWHAHNTDVHGIVAALRSAGATAPAHALVVGSGATARSAVAALGVLGAARVTFMVRGTPREQTVAQARSAGLAVDVVGLGDWTVADVVVSTVPPDAVTRLDDLPQPRGAGAVLDVVYGDGPTPLQRRARAAGWALAPGTDMLLHQAAAQVTLMTGRPAPLEAMAAALASVVDPEWGTPVRAGA